MKTCVTLPKLSSKKISVSSILTHFLRSFHAIFFPQSCTLSILCHPSQASRRLTRYQQCLIQVSISEQDFWHQLNCIIEMEDAHTALPNAGVRVQHSVATSLLSTSSNLAMCPQVQSSYVPAVATSSIGLTTLQIRPHTESEQASSAQPDSQVSQSPSIINITHCDFCKHTEQMSIVSAYAQL